jgi:hypothetical protein
MKTERTITTAASYITGVLNYSEEIKRTKQYALSNRTLFQRFFDQDFPLLESFTSFAQLAKEYHNPCTADEVMGYVMYRLRKKQLLRYLREFLSDEEKRYESISIVFKQVAGEHAAEFRFWLENVTHHGFYRSLCNYLWDVGCAYTENDRHIPPELQETEINYCGQQIIKETYLLYQTIKTEAPFLLHTFKEPLDL